MARAFGAKPGSNRNTNHDWSKASHVEAFIAFITKEELSGTFTGAALFADDVTVVSSLHHSVFRTRHYLRHWSQLLRQRGRRRTPSRCLGSAAGADKTPSPRHDGGWSHIWSDRWK
ncbi:hypothetical protein GOBAR_DD34953 [Gossypium barbadense]|nr:hypothetical protein GOBAR_DD34953 [Gossypium barbadense]